MKNLITVFLIFTALCLNATIIYTDVSPDETLIDSIEIDFDGDNQIEFTIRTQADVNMPVVTWFNPDAGFVMVTNDEVEGLTFNTLIGPSSDFLNNGNHGAIDAAHATVIFPTGVDTYIGATFKLGANIHYGWIRVNWTSSTKTLIVKDYAYEDVPNTSINAGDKGLTSNISEASENRGVSVYPNPSDEFIIIDSKAFHKIDTISIYSFDGKLVLNSSTFLNEKININHLEEGGYIIVLKSIEGDIYTDKLVKQ